MSSSSASLYKAVILLMMQSKRHVMSFCEQRNMTPPQAMLLMLFDPDKAWTMNGLSCHMGCDASNTTGLVDRLDSAGLIDRDVDPNDRRVKIVRLNDAGRQCQQDLLDHLSAAEALDTKALTNDEQAQLQELITKLLGGQVGSCKPKN